MNFHLAQINIGRTVGSMASPVMADFVANLDRINALAEDSPGFVWRLKDDSNSATSLKFFDDDFMIVNMSVWNSIDELFNYVYKSDHLEIFKRKSEWFEKMPVRHMALWYLPAGQTPTVQEALERLEYLRNHGDTPYAFSFRKKFLPGEAAQYVRVNYK